MIILLFVFAFILFLVHQFWYRRLNYPNGPLPLPFIGNLHSMWNEERVEYKFLEWKQKYGPIYTYFVGTQPFIGVNDFEIAVELFVKRGSDFEDRFTFERFFKAARGGILGIINTSQDIWRDQRRFALRVLREFGLNKNKMEERIIEEIKTICENVNRDIDAGVDQHDFHKYTDIASGSVINAVICGYRFTTGGKEAEFYKLKEIMDKIMKGFGDPIMGIAILSSFAHKLPIFKQRYDEGIDLNHQILDFLDSIIEDHIKNNDYKNEIEPMDFIDAYLIEMHRNEERGQPHYFSRAQLRNVCLDIWFAGQETTSSTITWIIAYLIVNQDVQAKMQQEIDRVIASDRIITVADKHDLHYCNAVIIEGQRMANILSGNLPHQTGRDMEIAGRQVKKGTIIIPQISVIMCDPINFDDPKRFNPSRFIDKDGNFKPSEKVVPFSIGRRLCLGEGLARMELFLFLVNIFNQYKLTASDIPPTLKKVSGPGSVATRPYKCRVQRRFN